MPTGQFAACAGWWLYGLRYPVLMCKIHAVLSRSYAGAWSRCWYAGMLLAMLAVMVVLAGCSSSPPPLKWNLNTSVQGQIPDLAFHLVDGRNQALTAGDFHGKVVMLYFGYTHCPDVCPLTMTDMHVALTKLGPLAKDVRILFVTVDPARDTPAVLHKYVKSFDKRAIGLTGSEQQIKALAGRYHESFSRGPSDGQGGYEVNHSAAIYIFDGKGRARLLATPADSPASVAHDLRQLIEQEHA
ncbi:MAG TPA: SCO family protein [Rhodanobacteraceae bacterium]